jgi:SAM-dependent methyltransferase
MQSHGGVEKKRRKEAEAQLDAFQPQNGKSRYSQRFYSVKDRSNGYEGVAAEFLAGRGNAQARFTAIGVKAVREWARAFPRGAAVIDLGCGPGFPITEILITERLDVYGIDASPSFVEAFRRNLPGIPIACEAIEDSTFFDRSFDGVLAWGLMFLLSEEEQRRLIQRIAAIMAPGGRLLFTSCAERLVWNDAMTGLESRSLGAVEYRSQLATVGLSLIREYEDEGENHYFEALKTAPALADDRQPRKGT